ncbi:MAG: polysaccharide deacetylase family sporulation protein PdaB [Bacillota bacterium]
MRVYYLNLKKLKKNAILAGLLLLVAFLLTMVLLYPQQEPVAGKHSGIIYKVKTDKKVCALTFDIGWGEKVPGPVLDILKQYNVKSTFFLAGPWAEKYPALARRIAREGHEVGSHGDRHINYSEYEDEVIKAEIARAHADIQKATGRAPRLIRTPNGDWNSRVVNVINQAGYLAVQWSVDSLDWKDPGVEAIVNRVLELVHPGAVILMHASDSADQTPAALPAVIRGLKEKGYTLVTVSELLKYGRGVAE